jgi:hypothetical protein
MCCCGGELHMYEGTLGVKADWMCCGRSTQAAEQGGGWGKSALRTPCAGFDEKKL